MAKMKDQLKEKETEILEGDTIVTSIYFGKRDGRLGEWASSIPRGAFSYVVRNAIKAYINQEKYELPRFGSNEKAVKLPFTKSLSIGKEDLDVYKFIVSIDKFYRGSEVKRILHGFLTETKVSPDVTKNIVYQERRENQDPESAKEKESISSLSQATKETRKKQTHQESRKVEKETMDYVNPNRNARKQFVATLLNTANEMNG